MSKKNGSDVEQTPAEPEPTNAKVTNAEQPKFPKLFGLAMLIGSKLFGVDTVRYQSFFAYK